MNKANSKLKYLVVLQEHLKNGVTVNNGQVTLNFDILENVFNALIQKISILFDPRFNEKTEDRHQNKFCVELNWLYSYILLISIHNKRSRYA